jgi:glucose/arabinose dehydrogenase
VDPGRVQVLATGLEAPWGIAFLPGGDALVSERDTARVLRVPARGGEPVEVRRLTEAQPSGEGGLLGLAVSPSFATDQLVYAYLTARGDNRVVRFRLSGGVVEPVVTGIPKAGVHNGGRIAFGPDGALYVGTGDAGERSLGQDAASLGGKVLRVVPGSAPEVFTLGHRNVQGLAFDATGRLWATEFGQSRLDEVNVLRRGANHGWPEVEGTGGGPRYADPVTTWSTDEASPSGAAVVGDSLWVAALRGERLWRVPLDDPGSPVVALRGYGRLRAAAAAPDGSLWVLTSNRDGRGSPSAEDDRVLRLPPV